MREESCWWESTLGVPSILCWRQEKVSFIRPRLLSRQAKGWEFGWCTKGIWQFSHAVAVRISLEGYSDIARRDYGDKAGKKISRYMKRTKKHLFSTPPHEILTSEMILHKAVGSLRLSSTAALVQSLQKANLTCIQSNTLWYQDQWCLFKQTLPAPSLEIPHCLFYRSM